MRIWHLIAVDLQATAWHTSIYKGSVLVRAASEQQARELVRRDFAAAADLLATADAGPPWTRPEVVRVELIEDDLRYAADGDPEILELS